MTENFKLPLPIDQYLEEIVKDGQNHSTLLIKASPGSGKTTRLPWAFAQLTQKKILVLEPRRLAAKMAAERIAFEEKLKIGQEIGYHFRFDKKVGPSTKLIFYTEGTFLKTLIHNPNLEDVEMVILDEFHERHIETDVALAALRSLQSRRKDFKIVLMSATLDTKILNYFEDQKVIDITAPMYPIDLHYLSNQPSVLNLPLEKKVRDVFMHSKPQGDALVFVPGMREMQRVKDALGEEFGRVLFLHADLTKEEQEEAINPASVRKIILATNIAESSVTIPGIKVVIDSGIQREAAFSPWNGLKSLVDRPITKSSAIQRAGRAGRTSAGTCFRLYSEMDFNERQEFTIPEILKSDLTDTYLLSSELPHELNWLTSPPEASWLKSKELCLKLGVVTLSGELNDLGKKLSHYPVDARLSRILIAGENLKHSEKKKLLKFMGEEIEGDRSGRFSERLSFYLKTDGPDSSSFEKALLFGFIDQVAKFRPKQGDFIHYSGKIIKAHASQKNLTQGLYLILDITAKQEAISIVPIEEEWLYDLIPFPISEEETINFDDSITLKTQLKLGSLVLEESSKAVVWDNLKRDIKDKILVGAKQTFKNMLGLWKESKTYERLTYWAKSNGISIIEIEEGLNLENYFEETQTLRFDDLPKYLTQYFESKLETGPMNENLPLKIHLGGRRELEIHYPLNMDPYVEAPIQDFYGQKSTPSIFKGKIPLTLKLLGPHKMPIQVTKDLAGFWQKTYPVLKKEWLREYPRHHWPDDPLTAEPYLLKSKRI